MKIRPKTAVPSDWKQVDPADRKRKTRQASRVIVRANSKVLLQADSDPGVPNYYWWVTPGGGVDPGETWRQAAVRELFEETGLTINESQLIGPVAHRVVSHGYSDRILRQEEQFFIIDVDEPFEPKPAALTKKEQSDLLGHEWFEVEQLAGLQVWPAQLVDLVKLQQDQFVELGEVEESTVPVDS